MGFWSNLLGQTNPVPVAAMTPNVTYVGSGDDLMDALNIRGLSVAQLWRTQPHLRTVVSFRARNVAQLGLHSFERDGEDRRRDRTSPFAQLMRRPNPDQTAFELIFSLIGDLDLYDRAYWLLTQDVEQPSGWSIRRLPPSWVSVSKSNAFAVTEWVVSSGDGRKSVTVPAGSILAFTGYHPTNPRLGSSTVESLREVLAEQVEAAKFRSQVWKRGGRVSAVIQRPKDAPQWSPEAMAQFREDWYAKYTGNGPKAGGTPILEDGMTLQRIDFNAQEQQFVEAAKLALSTVASAYHVNPTMIGVLDNANYSNVREFRRMLYGDSLGPTLAQVEDRINTFLLPMLGMDDSRFYAEFNIAEKLQGSFEEQAQVMQTMVGAPIMTRNEGRAKFNLRAVPGGDALVTPLNVLVGGQASPTDSAPPKGAEGSPWAQLPESHPDRKSQCRGCGTKWMTADMARDCRCGGVKAAPSDPQRDKATDVLAGFFTRQQAAVLSRISAGADWWDGERWDRELADDLLPLAHSIAQTIGTAEAKRLGFTEDDYDPDRTVNFLKAVSERYATTVNETTKAQLDDTLASDEPDPAHVFEVAKESRAEGVGSMVTTFAAGFAVVEAAKQIAAANDVTPVKTWVTGPNPRPEHAAMNGQTVPIDEPFSDGNDWPGGLPGCNCSVTISIP